MKRLLVLTGLAVALMMSGWTTSARADASLYVVHGIPGGDLGAAAELPVDVSLNGECALKEFKFGDFVGPVTVPAGSHDVAIRLANTDSPCSNDPVISATIAVEDGKSYAVVAHLTEGGEATAGLYALDLSPTDKGKARVIAHHTAAAPTVDVHIQRDAEDPKSKSIKVPDFSNGDQESAEIRPGEWDVSIAPAGGTDAVFGPTTVELKPYNAYLVLAVGSLTNNTFTLLVEPVSGLK